VHPAVIEFYSTGRLRDALDRLAADLGRDMRGLDREEALVLAFLREAQAEAAEPLADKLRRSLDAARS
jgi:hypothetical protein